MALRDIDDSLSTYHQRTAQLIHLQLSLKEEERHCHWTEKRFKYGIVNQSEVSHCQIKLDELHIFINQTKLEKMISIVKLYQDFAGGYYVP